MKTLMIFSIIIFFAVYLCRQPAYRMDRSTANRKSAGIGLGFTDYGLDLAFFDRLSIKAENTGF